MDKNFFHILYSEKTVPDVLDKYCAPMLSSKNQLTRLKAARLLKYWSLLTDKAFFDMRLQKVFYTLYNSINDAYPTLAYELSGRIKGLLSAINKVDELEESTMKNLKQEFIIKKYPDAKDSPEIMDEYLEQINSANDNPLKEEFLKFFSSIDFESNEGMNPFNRVRDFFAFRIILEDVAPGDCIDELYEIANLMIAFFNENTFRVEKSKPLIQTGELNVKSNLIYIPEESGLKEEYQPLVKDYVMCPKKDGYQSLHFTVYDPYTDRHFEVQLRTRSMDIIASTLANHTDYKSSKYKRQQKKMAETIDFTKIHMKGFRYFKYTDPKTGEKKEFISDRAGITQSIPIKLEFEHFLTMF